MILLTNGCSWTWGGALGQEIEENEDLRLRSVWPHHLGQLLNCKEVHNLSEGCGSNDRILRTTYDWLASADADTLKDTIAVIQWSEPTRFEFYCPNEEASWAPNLAALPFENIESNWTRVKVDVCLGPAHLYKNKTLHETLENYLAYTSTPIQLAYKTLFQVEALTSILNSFNIKYFYWSEHLGIGYYPEVIKDRILKYPWIDFTTNGFEQWQYERVSEMDCHPSFLGHKQLAHIIHDRIKDKI